MLISIGKMHGVIAYKKHKELAELAVAVEEH